MTTTAATSLRRTVLAIAAAFALQSAAWAEPPPHAPAHGWRKKHDPDYVGYTGSKWSRDYGILGGRCNREEVGAVVGGVVGGALGSQVGRGEERVVAIILGTVLGAAVGARIGRDMDDADRACFGHALELARVGQDVQWRGADGLRYRLKTKGKSRRGEGCREYELRIKGRGFEERERGVACRSAEGIWRALG